MRKSILFAAMATVTLTLVSCKKEGCTDPTALNYSSEAKKDDGTCTHEEPSTPSVPAHVLIGTSTTTQNETVRLYADDSLSAGYTRLYAEVEDATGAIMDDATVEFAPLMDMGMMQHSCPIIQPTYNASTERHEGVVIFQMSSMGGTWTIDVNVNGNPANFALNVAEPDTKVVGVYTGDDTEKYIVSVVRPENWVVGNNDLDIYIHKKATMMSFPAVTDLDIVLDPEMVSMGHGSTGNISPTHVANGLYSGIVNLNMSGDWRLHMELSRNSTLVHSDAFLDILF
jgi:hypothetical protein